MRPFALLSLALLLVACDPPEDSGAGSNPSALSNPTGEAEQRVLRELRELMGEKGLDETEQTDLLELMGKGLDSEEQKQFVELAAKPDLNPAEREQKEKLEKKLQEALNKEPTSAGQQQTKLTELLKKLEGSSGTKTGTTSTGTGGTGSGSTGAAGGSTGDGTAGSQAGSTGTGGTGSGSTGGSTGSEGGAASTKAGPLAVEVRANRAPTLSFTGATPTENSRFQLANVNAQTPARSFFVTATDPEGDTLSYEWYEGGSSTATSTESSWTYQQFYSPIRGKSSSEIQAMTEEERHNVLVRADVGDGQNTVSETRTLRLNIAPAIASVTAADDATYAVRGGSLVYTVNASDKERDTLSYQWHYRRSGATSWTDLTGSTTATFAPAANWPLGNYQIAVTVTDSEGGTANTKAGPKAVEVRANSAPTLSFTGATPTENSRFQLANVNAQTPARSFFVTATDPEGDTLSYEWYEGGSSTATSTESSWTDQQFYSPVRGKSDTEIEAMAANERHNVLVRADVGDGQNTVSETRTLRLNIAPAIASVTAADDATYAVRGGSLVYTVNASDKERDTLSYQWHYRRSGATSWIDLPGSTTATFAPAADWDLGNYEIAVTVTDSEGGAASTKAAPKTVEVRAGGSFSYTAITATAGGPTIRTRDLTGMGGFNADHYTFEIAKDLALLPNGVGIDPATGQISVHESVVTAAAAGSYTVTATPKSKGPAATASFTITVPKTSISTAKLIVSAPPTFAANAMGEQLAADAISVNDAAGNSLRLGTDYTLAIAFRNDLGAFTPAQGVKTQIQDVNDVLNLAITDDGKVSATPVSGNPPDAATYIYVVTATGMGDYEGTVTQEVTITVEFAFAYTTAITATAGGTTRHTSDLTGMGGFNADHYTFEIAKDLALLPNGVGIHPATGQIIVHESGVTAVADGRYTVTATPDPKGLAAGGENVTASVRITIN